MYRNEVKRLTLFGLKHQFVQQDGQYMILDREEGLSYAELGRLQLKMLEHNQIPYLIPLEIEERDLKLKLRYQLGTKRALELWLKGNRFTQKDFFYFYHQIVDLIFRSKDYMLNEKGFVLKLDWIYVDSIISNVYLVYLPLHDYPGQLTVEQQLRDLALSIIPHIHEIQGTDVQELIQFLNEPFTILSLKKKLQDTIGKLAIYAPENMTQAVPHLQGHSGTLGGKQVSQKSSTQILPDAGRSISIPARIHTPFEMKEREPFILSQPASSKQILGEEVNHDHSSELKPLTGRGKIFLFLVCLVLTAFVWKGYELYPHKGLLYISIGLSLLIWNGGFIYHSVWRPGVNKKKDSRSSSAELVNRSSHAANQHSQAVNLHQQAVNQPYRDVNQYQQAVNQQYRDVNQQSQAGKRQPSITKRQLQDKKKPDIPLNSALSSETIKNSNQIQKIEDDYNQPPNETRILSSSFQNNTDPTVVLNERKNPNKAVSQAGYLLVTRNGQEEERILISKSPFVIGRNDQKVDYVETSVGVSRAHIELIQTSKGLFVKDLGSKNGTKVNGALIITNQEIPLSHHDLIEIAPLVSYEVELK